jgi:hypothetical protein
MLSHHTLKTGGHVMPFYHFRFVEDGRVVIDENYECADDGTALLLAQSVMKRGNYQGSEISLGERSVGNLTGAHEWRPQRRRLDNRDGAATERQASGNSAGDRPSFGRTYFLR